MTAKRNFSYENVKAILEKMPAETRIDLALLSKKENTADKCTPMELESLTIKDLEFTINGTRTYRVATYSPWINMDGKEEVREWPCDVNSKGCDVDKVQVPKPADEMRFGWRERCRNSADNEESREKYQKFLLKNAEKNDKEKTDPEVYKQFKIREELLFPEQCPVGQVAENQLILMTVLNGDKVETVEKLVYNRSVHDAMRYIVFKAFGGRKDNVSVDTLKVHLNRIHRFPADLKLRVRKMEIHNVKECNVDHMMPLFHPSSFPMEWIRTDAYRNVYFKLFKQSKELQIRTNRCQAKYETLVHKNVAFFGGATFSRIYDEGIHTSLLTAKVGTCYFFSYCVAQAKGAAKFFVDVKGAQRILTEDEDLSLQPEAILPVALPLSNTTEIKMYFESEEKNHGIYLLVQPRVQR